MVLKRSHVMEHYSTHAQCQLSVFHTSSLKYLHVKEPAINSHNKIIEIEPYY